MFVLRQVASLKLDGCVNRCHNRSPQPGGPIDEFDADFHIGHRMKISRRHAMIYWSHDKQCFELKSICKNAVRVNGKYQRLMLFAVSSMLK
jgi:hypothetical protein